MHSTNHHVHMIDTTKTKELSMQDIDNAFLERFGTEGQEILASLLTTIHKHTHHQGAPRTGYLARYFALCALGNPDSSQEHDYEALTHKFSQAINIDKKNVEVLPIEKLNKIMQPYWNELNKL